MPGISSAIGYIGAAKQTVKGTGIAQPAFKLPLAARPSLRPVKNRNRYTVTDVGRDMGPAYTSQMMVQGDFQVYVEPQQIASLLYYALGAVADSGTTNFTHTITPANDVPWVTFFRMVGNAIFEQFVDCKVTNLRIEGSAGNALLVTISVVGIQSVFAAADFTGTIVTPGGLLYPEGFNSLKVDTVAQPISDFTLEINNNLSPFQADNYVLQDVDPGKREITLSFTTRFTSAIMPAADYRAYYYGSDAGTALSPVVAQHAFDFTFVRNANVSLELLCPQVEYASVPVDADPGGAPIEVAVTGTVEKPPAAAIMTAIAKDQLATTL